eukprot:TRINITY_DN7956_c0_g2_i1.p1 TRINITY_DN7956_c0_g2~~TRINITY_DN7956_c0_g2_i1.p1  ORF type:complete len:731 (-),score=98.39 TRINITY_DN7956_c0_g2_i1:317-2509(-)
MSQSNAGPLAEKPRDDSLYSVPVSQVPTPRPSKLPRKVSAVESDEVQKILEYNFISKINYKSQSKRDNNNGVPGFACIFDADDVERDSIISLGDESSKVDKNEIPYLAKIHIIFLCFILFAVEYSYSVEIVYITPFFMRIDTPPLFDSIIWAFPPLIVVIIYPFIRILCEKMGERKYMRRKQLLGFFTAMLAAGFLVLAESENVAYKIHFVMSERKKTALILAMVGFMLLDVGNEMLNCIVRNYVNDMVREEDMEFTQDYMLVFTSIGKILGFVNCSFLAMNIRFTNRFGDNLCFSYLVGFGVCCLIFAIVIPCLPTIAIRRPKGDDDKKTLADDDERKTLTPDKSAEEQPIATESPYKDTSKSVEVPISQRLALHAQKGRRASENDLTQLNCTKEEKPAPSPPPSPRHGPANTTHLVQTPDDTLNTIHYGKTQHNSAASSNIMFNNANDSHQLHANSYQQSIRPSFANLSARGGILSGVLSPFHPLNAAKPDPVPDPDTYEEPASYKQHVYLLSANSFLPGITLLHKVHFKQQMNLLAHFFAASNVLMVMVYATSWVGFTILDGVPNASKFSLRRRIFDIGVSWGSIAMLFTALVSVITTILLPKLRYIASDKVIFIVTQLISAIALLQTYQYDSFKAIFIILPLCGFSFATFYSMPEAIAAKIESEYDPEMRGVYTRMLTSTLFLSQVMMFCVVPSCFYLFPEMDDILWGLLVAGICGALSCFFGLFV